MNTLEIEPLYLEAVVPSTEPATVTLRNPTGRVHVGRWRFVVSGTSGTPCESLTIENVTRTTPAVVLSRCYHNEAFTAGDVAEFDSDPIPTRSWLNGQEAPVAVCPGAMALLPGDNVLTLSGNPGLHLSSVSFRSSASFPPAEAVKGA